MFLHKILPGLLIAPVGCGAGDVGGQSLRWVVSSWACVTVVKPGLSAVDDAESGCGETER